MEDLIEALQIFSKYMDPYRKEYPTICVHDYLIINCDHRKITDSADRKRLEELSFTVNGDYDGYASSKFGSA